MVQYTSETWGGEWIAEATFPIVRMIPAYKARHNIVAEFEVLFDIKPSLQKASKFFGDHYDIIGMAYLGWFIVLWTIFKKKIQKPFYNVKGEFCSELVAYIYRYSNLPETQLWFPSLTSPGIIYQYNLKHPELFRLINP